MATITESVDNAVTVGDEVVAYVQSLLAQIASLQSDTTTQTAADALDVETAKLQALLPVVTAAAPSAPVEPSAA